MTAEHLRLGWQFVRGTLDAPPWAKRALFYCGPADSPGSCERRGGEVVLGKIAHTYWTTKRLAQKIGR